MPYTHARTCMHKAMFIVSICAGIKDSSAEDITNIMWWPKAKHVISVKRDEHSQVKKRSKVGFWTKNLNRMYIASFNVLLRSPGGTPLKTRSQNTSVPADSDPAAIIAHALQRKFSHSVFKDSPGQQPLNASSTLWMKFVDTWNNLYRTSIPYLAFPVEY